MSWLDRIKNDLIITTGDGATYKPNWLNAVVDMEFNAIAFEFIEVSGSLVKRFLPKGSKYNIEIYFQGDDHLDTAASFRESSKDPRAWRVSHPYYGTLIVQPTNLLFDNSKGNITRITGGLWETIVEDNPKGTVDAVDQISFDKLGVDTAFIQGYANAIPLPNINDVNLLRGNIAGIYKAGLVSILKEDANAYFNAFTSASNALLNLASDIFNTMQLVTDLINAPINFVNTVKSRVKTLISQFNTLRTAIQTLANTASTLFNKNSKKSYEHNAGGVISSMALAAVTNMDYQNRNDVIATMNDILTQYNIYLNDLDSFQDTNANSPSSYMPDADSLILLGNLINFTISSLFVIGLNSKQERALYCEQDTNLITLANRLYGLQPDDSTIDTLMKNNNIGLNEILSIKKGRKIVWYI